MAKQFLLYFGLLFSVLGFSQEFSVSGSVKDTDKKPIAYANVVLVTSDSGELYLGVTTDEQGEFSIRGISPGTYLFKVTYMGYEGFSKEVFVETNLSLENIILKENLLELDGVTVVAKRPTVKR